MVDVNTCHRCTGRHDPGESLVECSDCGTAFHESCYEYYTQYLCSRCGEERWIGAVEFSPDLKVNASIDEPGGPLQR